MIRRHSKTHSKTHAGATAASLLPTTDLRGRQGVGPTVESRLGESVPGAVLPLGHQGLCPFDDVTHAVDEALLLRRQDKLVVHLEDTADTNINESDPNHSLLD